VKTYPALCGTQIAKAWASMARPVKLFWRGKQKRDAEKELKPPSRPAPRHADSRSDSPFPCRSRAIPKTGAYR